VGRTSSWGRMAATSSSSTGGTRRSPSATSTSSPSSGRTASPSLHPWVEERRRFAATRLETLAPTGGGFETRAPAARAPQPAGWRCLEPGPGVREDAAEDLLDLVELGRADRERGRQLHDGVAAVIRAAVEPRVEERLRHESAQQP